jgi:hypothetical protein
MDVWYILTAILLVGVVAFMFVSRKRVENFSIMSDMSEFMKQQKTRFYDQLDLLTGDSSKEFVVNNGVRLTDLNSALSQPDLYLRRSPDVDYVSNFRKDESLAALEYNMKYCRGVVSPKDLPAIQSSGYNCGWWFVEGVGNSVGAVGTSRGAVFQKHLEKTHPGGEWIWNRADAERKEDIKFCRTIRNCSTLEGTELGQRCGFCVNKGYAVPKNANGGIKYPTDSIGGCGPNQFVATANMCPVTTTAAAAAAAADAVRVDRDGNIIPGTGAGSTGSVGAGLGTGAGAGFGTGSGAGAGAGAGLEFASTGAGTCTPINGLLTPTCLLTVAMDLGFSENGRLFQLIRSGRQITSVNDFTDQVDKIAYTKLSNELGGSLPIGVFGKGNITHIAAINAYTAIGTACVHSNDLIAGAAKWFKFGTPYDICQFKDTDSGPFPVACVEREFRIAGCQPAGSEVPKESTMSKYNSLTWAGIKSAFKTMYDNTKSSDKSIQDAAMIQCLGPVIYRQAPEVCDEPGIEYIVFDTNGNLISRRISKSGLLSPSSIFTTGPFTYIARTSFPSRYNTQIAIIGSQSKNESIVKIDENMQPIAQSTQSGSGYSARYEVRMPPRIARKYNIDILGDQGTDLTSQDINTRLQQFHLRNASWKPFMSFDFYKNTILDTNSIFGINSVSTGLVDGKRCAYYDVSQTSGSSIYKGVQFDLIGSIAFMINIQDVSQMTESSILLIERKDQNKSLSVGVTRVDGVVSGLYFKIQDGGATQTKTFNVLQTNLNKWMHVAIVMNTNRNGFDIYINGVPSTKQSIVFANLSGWSTVMNTIEIGRTGYKGGYAWFHMYNYRLTESEIKRDMNFDNPNYVMEEPTENMFYSPQYDYEYKMIPGKFGSTSVRLTSGQLNHPSITEENCNILCRSDTRCKGFVYRTNGSICNLYKDVNGIEQSFTGEKYAIMTDRRRCKEGTAQLNDLNKSDTQCCPYGNRLDESHTGTPLDLSIIGMKQTDITPQNKLLTTAGGICTTTACSLYSSSNCAQNPEVPINHP